MVKYIVQKSTNGGSFKDIATINAQQLVSNKYNFTDNEPAEVNTYYRIKIIEVSGSSSFSKTIFIKNTSDFTVVTYPNPVQNNFKLSVPAQHLPAKIEILDTQGKPVYAAQTNAVTTQVNQALTKGVYIVKVTSNKNITVTQRLIKN